MEKKLKALFDYQRFEKNQSLEKLISDSEDRFARELTDEDLFFVNAAGDPEGYGADAPQTRPLEQKEIKSKELF